MVYDIEDDRTRARIANVCKDYGLERVQYSAFSGPLSVTMRGEMIARLGDTLGDEVGKVLVLPVCEKDLAAKREMINAPPPGGSRG